MSIAGKIAQLAKPARMFRLNIAFLLNHEMIPQECYLLPGMRQDGLVHVRKRSELSQMTLQNGRFALVRS